MDKVRSCSQERQTGGRTEMIQAGGLTVDQQRNGPHWPANERRTDLRESENILSKFSRFELNEGDRIA